jgi:hypothetical protein
MIKVYLIAEVYQSEYDRSTESDWPIESSIVFEFDEAIGTEKLDRTSIDNLVLVCSGEWGVLVRCDTDQTRVGGVFSEEWRESLESRNCEEGRLHHEMYFAVESCLAVEANISGEFHLMRTAIYRLGTPKSGMIAIDYITLVVNTDLILLCA